MPRNLSAAGLVAFTLAACGAPSAPAPAEPGPPVSALTVPPRYGPHTATAVYARYENGDAHHDTLLSYALGDEYPTRMTVSPTGPVYLAAAGCLYSSPTVATWAQLTEVRGDAAALTLDGGILTVDLRHEGAVTALLEGELHGPGCTIDGVLVKRFTLRHRLTVHVQRVHGFVVEHVNRFWRGCATDVMAVPSGVDLALPTVHPLSEDGTRFDAANAPVPAALTLRADGGLIATRGKRWRHVGPGHVTLEVDTLLPVSGLKAFEVVGPSQLTSLAAALYLSLEASKGSVPHRIQDGQSYRVFFPDGTNVIEVHPEQASTSAGPLCAAVPAAWFASASETPAQCPTTPPDADAYGVTAGVARIASPGECRLAVTVPGTAFGWTAAFTTTR